MSKKLTLGSLFDGISGFPYAAEQYEIETLWTSEIEPAPSEISKHHFPTATQLGDVTKINGAEIPPVDIISFGSPCQDMSIAGNRAGLDGNRSSLFHEAVRIIREMRNKTNGEYPTYAIWENVPGAFSSNKGEDFRRVLEEIAETEIPIPQGNKWAENGMVELPNRSVAWRTFDAQYWGVPQRRRRIYLITDFRGQRAAEILFKPESVSGNITQSGETRQGTSTVAESGT